jgi:hypothetical protein
MVMTDKTIAMLDRYLAFWHGLPSAPDEVAEIAGPARRLGEAAMEREPEIRTALHAPAEHAFGAVLERWCTAEAEKRRCR